MKRLIIYAGIIVTFFAIGKFISKCNQPLMKKIIKSKKHIRATDRMVNNYWGNMISISGFIIATGISIDITSFNFFGIIAILVMTGYLKHLSDVAGVPVIDTFSYIVNIKNPPVKQYLAGTTCICAAIMIAGVAAPYIAPYIYEEKEKTETVQEETFPKEYIHETTKEKDRELIEAVKEAFN